ncbi:MAG: bioD [Caulobacteraceae bacterium]|nr:bioD [Caulobacteraceae bacterium]
MTTLFVTGSGTDVGKTHVLVALIAALRAAGATVDALKPAVSGLDPADWALSDSGRLLGALGQPLTAENLARLSPYRFAAPLSADAAARAQGQRLELSDLAAVCRQARSAADWLLIEGAGGVMSPIAEGATNLDLMEELGAPVLLVGGNYLGTVSHVLTAALAVRSRGLDLVGVVLSETGPVPPLADNASAIGAFLPDTPILQATIQGADWAGPLVAVIRPRGPASAGESLI